VPRQIFTVQHLSRFVPLLDHPLALQVLASAVPVKQPAAAVSSDATTLSQILPVQVESRGQTEGVPLHNMLAVLQEQVPAVASLSVRDNSVSVATTAPLSGDEREKVRAFFANQAALTALKAPPDPTIATLTNAATSDQDWLKAFRTYAVKNLIKG
jgi:hypothetical protein